MNFSVGTPECLFGFGVALIILGPLRFQNIYRLRRGHGREEVSNERPISHRVIIGSVIIIKVVPS